MELAFTKRGVTGKKVAELRKQDMTPVVCYGNNEDSQVYSVDTRSLLKCIASDEVVIETAGDLPGKRIILQDISFHQISGIPLHADFLFVDTESEVEHEVSVQVLGEAPGVKLHGGQMVVALDKVTISALPQHIPSHIDADVSTLDQVGSHLLVSNLLVPDSVKMVTNPDEIVVSIVMRSEEEEEQMDEKEHIENMEVSGKGKKKEKSDDSEEEANV